MTPLEREALCSGRKDWFITVSGGIAFIRSPELSSISIEDIGVALSRICRFGGHLRADVPFYSVAQHSVIVSKNVCQPLCKQALLHDASEAYLGDVIRPLKREISGLYSTIERDWEREIGQRFGLGDRLADGHPDIKAADIRALMTERRDLVNKSGPLHWPDRVAPFRERIVPLSPVEAADEFLDRFYELAEAA